MKRFISFVICIVLAVGLMTTAGAVSATRDDERLADKLNSLNLFQGTDDGYKLGSVPTRMQGLVMLIRLLGLEEDALAYKGEEAPFTDLTWGKKYVHYAYDEGLTKGSGDGTTFSPEDNLAPSGYITFLLRALGYSEAAGDFKWGTQFECAARIGLIDEESVVPLKSARMSRGDLVEMSYAALTCPMKNKSTTLAQKLVRDGVFTKSAGEAAGIIGGEQVSYHYAEDDEFAISREVVKIPTSEGDVSANVVRVNTNNYNVKVKAALVDNTIDHTANFKDIVAESGAFAVFNGNFFTSYSEFKTPIGHVMVDGEFLLATSGLDSLGITKYGELITGTPAVFTRITADSGRNWAIYEINGTYHGDSASVLYSSAFGESVTYGVEAYALVIAEDEIVSYSLVPAETVVPIPDNGYVCFIGKEFAATSWYKVPVVGESVTITPYLKVEDAEGFTLDNMESIISGGPRLMRDGEIVTTLGGNFSEARFTTLATTRTAIGIDTDGYLVLVSVPKATIQQMRELMKALDCVDAINLDGGGSCAMYYDGTYYATPGRKLTSTIQIFVEE